MATKETTKRIKDALRRFEESQHKAKRRKRKSGNLFSVDRYEEEQEWERGKVNDVEGMGGCEIDEATFGQGTSRLRMYGISLDFHNRRGC